MNLRQNFGNILKYIQPEGHFIVQSITPVVLAMGIIYGMIQIFRADWIAFVLFLPGWALLFGISNFPLLQRKISHHPYTFYHLLHIIFYWFYTAIWSVLLELLINTPSAGKQSQLFYVVLVAFLGITWAIIRSALIVLVSRAYRYFSTNIPLWEQVLLTANEGIAIGLMAYVWGSLLVRIFQPQVFTTRLNLVYGLGLSAAALLYYVGMQLMWSQRWNNWLSQSQVWIVLARIFSPFILFVVSMLLASRFTDRMDPRTANLLDNADVDLAVLSLVPVVWLLVFVIMVLVYTSRRGLKERFLPDTLLEHLPRRLQVILAAISDMDLLLVVGFLVTFIPVYLLFLGEGGGVIGDLRQAILQRGSALIETSEQALAILFVVPFYVFILLILFLYGVIISRPYISAQERDEMMRILPVGILITMILTLYLFAIPFTQVFTEGRLPTFSRDLGRILIFYVLLPLILLYVHYLSLIRLPYGRGQKLWRERYAVKLDQELRNIDRRIRNLNQELTGMDNKWQIVVAARGDDLQTLRTRLDTLHRYIHLNGERDDLNMQRLQIVAAKQTLAEISETPLSVAVARLPLRIISIGIPLLLVFQLYQWAVLNQGLRDVVNNPNLTIVDFIQILLDNIEF